MNLPVYQLSVNRSCFCKDIMTKTYNERHGTDFSPETLTTDQLVLILIDYVRERDAYVQEIREHLS